MNGFMKYAYRWLLVPGLMGVFFGLGHFLAYLFFSQNTFQRFEQRFNKFIDELM
jgi:DMSO/TMAO reductase YedYZ heme-binding membrane subunit